MAKKESTVKKTYNLPQDLIARVKKILGAKTETEAIVLALREMAFMEDVDRALRNSSGKLPKFRPLR